MKRGILSIALVVILTACSRENKDIKLLVYISIDHFSTESFENYRPAFTGGLKWLNDHGVYYSKNYHEYGKTSTGPGHFVLGSGRYPGPAGILDNNWYDVNIKKSRYVVEDQRADSLSVFSNHVSYRNVDADAVGDWLKAQSPNSKVYSLAVKDRASILMGGKHPDLAVWYNWRGAFTTTDYYVDALPDWLSEFNRGLKLLRYRDSLWTPSLPDSFYKPYTHGDYFEGETDRYMSDDYSPVFPIGFEPDWDDGKVLSRLGGYPWIENHVLQLARIMIEEGELGTDADADLMCLGFSALDLINHYYGPNSKESMDYLVKLDGYLGEFLDYLNERIGLDHVAFVISSDHGGSPLPEHLEKFTSIKAGRIDRDAYDAAYKAAFTEIKSLYGHNDFIKPFGISYIFENDEYDKSEIVSVFKKHLEPIQGIYRVYAKAELEAADPEDQAAVRLSRGIHPEYGPDMIVVNDAFWLHRREGSSHGMPWDHDAHIPLIVSSGSFSQKTMTDSISSVDVAATVADLLGLKLPADVDGKPVRIPR